MPQGFLRSAPRSGADFSRGLSEHSERYPRSTSTASFLARLRRAGIREISFTGGCALRAYLRLKSCTAPRCRPQKTLRHCPERVRGFLPQVFLLKLHSAQTQQLNVLLFERLLAMVLHLVCNVAVNPAQLRRTHRKRSVPFLPRKLAYTVLVNPHR